MDTKLDATAWNLLRDKGGNRKLAFYHWVRSAPHLGQSGVHCDGPKTSFQYIPLRPPEV